MVNFQRKFRGTIQNIREREEEEPFPVVAPPMRRKVYIINFELQEFDNYGNPTKCVSVEIRGHEIKGVRPTNGNEVTVYGKRGNDGVVRAWKVFNHSSQSYIKPKSKSVIVYYLEYTIREWVISKIIRPVFRCTSIIIVLFVLLGCLIAFIVLDAPNTQTTSQAIPTVIPTLAPTTSSSSEPESIVRPSIIQRSVWGAEPPQGRMVSQTPSKIILTHSGNEFQDNQNARDLIRNIQKNHQNRNWPDIAWHYIIDREGNIYEGRDPSYRADTAYNFDTDGIIVIGVLGNYDRQQPNRDQLDAIVLLMAWLAQQYAITPDQIYPHSDFANPKTTSPGRNFDMADIRRQVAHRLDGK